MCAGTREPVRQTMRLQEARALLRSTFVAADEWLDAWAERHRAELRVLWRVSSFVLLFGGVAYHVHESGFAAVRCGEPCASIAGSTVIVAAACGVAAIVFVWLFAAASATVQRALFDPWQFVRPGPKPAKVPRWAKVIHIVLGFVIFFAIAALGHEQFTESGLRLVRIAHYNALALILGWWIGGSTVLGVFWRQARRRDGIETE
jgi:hypothetical protein